MVLIILFAFLYNSKISWLLAGKRFITFWVKRRGLVSGLFL